MVYLNGYKRPKQRFTQGNSASEIDKVKFIPAWGKNRLTSMIEKDPTGQFLGKDTGEYRFPLHSKKSQIKRGFGEQFLISMKLKSL